MTTTFSLEQAFELGQLEIYENIEGVPSVEMTINRLLDGTAMAYVLCAGSYANADSINLASQNTFNVRLGIWDEAVVDAAGEGSNDAAIKLLLAVLF